MNNLLRITAFSLIVVLSCVQIAEAAATRFTSPAFGVESVIFGGTGTLRTGGSVSPPVITAGPTVSAITTTSATVSWNTDLPSNSVVKLGTTSGVYSSESGQLTNTTFTNHEVNLTNLNKATQYFYKVQSSDVSGNMVESGENTFTTDAGDVTAPVITSGPSIAKNSASLITITWETDEASSSFVEYGRTAVTENSIGRPDDLTTLHQVQVSGLQSSQNYLIRVVSSDTSGNTTKSAIQNLETLQSPNITEVRISDITLNSAVIEWKTTTPSTSILNYGTSSGSYTETNSQGDTVSTTHVTRLSGLQTGTIYYLRISGNDPSGNRLVSDEYIFRTVVLPVISEFVVTEVGSSSVKLTWLSSSEIDEFIRYEITKSDDPRLLGKKFTAGNDVLTASHVFLLSDLESGTEYSATVLGKDVFGNQATSSTILFTTLQDNEPPLIESVRSDTTVDLGSKSTVQVLVSFGLSELGLAKIEYGENARGAYTKSVETDTEYSRNKFMIIPQLEPGQSYHFRIVAKDRAGNEATSADFLVLAPARRVELFDLIIGEVRNNFGWLTQIGK